MQGEKKWTRANEFGGQSMGGGGCDRTKGWNSRGNMQRSRRSQDPWWMREEEKNNPRVLPVYKPWWAEDPVEVTDKWSVVDLKSECKRRSLLFPRSVKKGDLLEMLKDSNKKTTLTDEGFLIPIYKVSLPESEISCYPNCYEGEAGIEELKTKVMGVQVPGS